MAIQDAENLKQSLVRATKKAKGRGKDAVVKAALRDFRRDGAKQRKAMVALNIVCMAIRSKWTELPFQPFLRKLNMSISQKVDDPRVRLSSITRNPLIWVLCKVSMFLWRRKWGVDEEYVRDWRRGF
eukprot:CAMPEP_0173426632 /NCGR_PEP_ID=MMETSP1357-20121228/6047_1 /TAXON_ID=77926 /ORGANISM="Hemiselmis rufescens, Strain PCC563" /LENGTH=126 /DNA_ID=CAMNT_0014390337 /DNA_START=95 /DNA_END=475 /DNA_ORIENTATION=+